MQGCLMPFHKMHVKASVSFHLTRARGASDELDTDLGWSRSRVIHCG